MPSRVRWVIRIHPSVSPLPLSDSIEALSHKLHAHRERKCVHVNLVKKTNVPGEEEYLFAPYSAFTVLSVRWGAGTAAAPHEIELLAAVDNKAEREDLPLAPWS